VRVSRIHTHKYALLLCVASPQIAFSKYLHLHIYIALACINNSSTTVSSYIRIRHIHTRATPTRANLAHAARAGAAEPNKHTTHDILRGVTWRTHKGAESRGGGAQIIGLLQKIKIYIQSINQRSSQSHTRAKEKPHPSTTTRGGKPCITK